MKTAVFTIALSLLTASVGAAQASGKKCQERQDRGVSYILFELPNGGVAYPSHADLWEALHTDHSLLMHLKSMQFIVYDGRQWVPIAAPESIPSNSIDRACSAKLGRHVTGIQCRDQQLKSAPYNVVQGNDADLAIAFETLNQPDSLRRMAKALGCTETRVVKSVQTPAAAASQPGTGVVRQPIHLQPPAGSVPRPLAPPRAVTQ